MSGRAPRTSSGVHSGFSASGRLAFLRIRAFLSLVRSPQTDDPDRLASGRDHRRVKLAVDRAQHAQSSFAVILAGVLDGDRRLEVHIGKSLEGDPAVALDLGALGRVEVNQRNYIVYTKK